MVWSFAQLVMICIVHKQVANFEISDDWPTFMELGFACKDQSQPGSVQSKVHQQSTCSSIIQRIRSDGTSILLS